MSRKTVPPFVVGEKVLCAYAPWGDFEIANSKCWRTKILRIERDLSCGSGWLAVGAASKPCKCCGHILHEETKPVDSAWFRKLPKRKPVTK